MSTLKRDKQSLLITNPDLAKEWDYEKNAPLIPQDITAGSNKKVWWKCPEGHEWEVSPNERSRGRGCPFCSGHRVIPGKNDLQTKFPNVAAEWNYEKNIGISPTEIMAGSSKRVWWKCATGHEWQAVVTNRTTLNRGCPYCANILILKGYNDLTTTNPDLVKEWNYEKNGTLVPEDVGAGTAKKVWWKCSEGHVWQTAVVKRTGKNPTGCPYCSNTKILVGFNDLSTTNPSICSEWNHEKNGDLSPLNVGARSNKNVWWLGKCGHEWKAQISNRILRGDGCPYCSGHRVLEGFNDLATTHPELLIEWDYEKNTIKPNTISYGSNQKVWWKCENGHEWESQITNRVHGTACPICGRKYHNSFCEQALFFYIKQRFPDAINSDIHIGAELDIYIPSINVALEYDGVVWHKSRKKEKSDIEKNTLCKENGITMIRIREEGLSDIADCVIFKRMKTTSNTTLSQVISEVMLYLDPTNEIEINVVSDTPRILEQYATKEHENSLAYCFPELVPEWHPSKNGSLKPDRISRSSNKYVWWKCQNNHEWSTKVVNRTINKQGCPFCSGHQVLAGFNDLSTWCKQNDHGYLLLEWDYAKNANSVDGKGRDISTPDKVAPRSNRKVWWTCSKCGYEWQAIIQSRTRGNGCPACKNKK